MASLQNRNGSYAVFYHHGRRHYITLGQDHRAGGGGEAAQVDYLLLRIRQGSSSPARRPDRGVHPRRREGQDAGEASARADKLRRVPGAIPRHPRGTGRWRRTASPPSRMHLGHFARTLGDGFPLAELALADLQRHVDGRAKEEAPGHAARPVTLRKEVATFRAAWNWGGEGLVGGPFPTKGLVYPKADEKPPFLTREEIERRIGRGGLTEAQRPSCGTASTSRRPEIDELLAYVKERAAHPWIYPLRLLRRPHRGQAERAAAGAGRRRGPRGRHGPHPREEAGPKGQRTTRRVPLTPSLVARAARVAGRPPRRPAPVLPRREVARSKKRSRTTGHQNGEGRATIAQGPAGDGDGARGPAAGRR